LDIGKYTVLLIAIIVVAAIAPDFALGDLCGALVISADPLATGARIWMLFAAIYLDIIHLVHSLKLFVARLSGALGKRQTSGDIGQATIAGKRAKKSLAVVFTLLSLDVGSVSLRLFRVIVQRSVEKQRERVKR